MINSEPFVLALGPPSKPVINPVLFRIGFVRILSVFYRKNLEHFRILFTFQMRLLVFAIFLGAVSARLVSCAFKRHSKYLKHMRAGFDILIRSCGRGVSSRVAAPALEGFLIVLETSLAPLRGRAAGCLHLEFLG